MNDLGPLFAQPASAAPIPGYRRDSDTSLAAAVSIAPKVRAIHMLILGTIRRFGAMTADECSAKLAMDPDRIKPRFTELSKPKYGLLLLEKAGEKRPSRLGGLMHAYRLTAKAVKHVDENIGKSGHTLDRNPSQSTIHAPKAG